MTRLGACFAAGLTRHEMHASMMSSQRVTRSMDGWMVLGPDLIFADLKVVWSTRELISLLSRRDRHTAHLAIVLGR